MRRRFVKPTLERLVRRRFVKRAVVRNWGADLPNLAPPASGDERSHGRQPIVAREHSVERPAAPRSCVHRTGQRRCGRCFERHVRPARRWRWLGVFGLDAERADETVR